MRNRFENALAISSGACNPSGIAYAIVEACQEARKDGAYVNDDPAIKLMVSQLAYVTGIWDGISNWYQGDFGEATSACREQGALAYCLRDNDPVEAQSL